MEKVLLVTLPDTAHLEQGLCDKLDADSASVTMHQFPDGETYLRYNTSPQGRDTVILCTLVQPNEKFLPLIFAAATARDLGATSVGLVAPYLAYMRQDRRFEPGEAVTSNYFARLLSGAVDWLVTVDPHLHRREDLSEIYTIPAVALHAGPLIAQWVKNNVEHPLLIGPDFESLQWVKAVARKADAPYLVLDKIRHGDRDVEVSVPDVGRWRSRTPVLIDDIISTARTMAATITHLKAAQMRSPICIGVHGLFTQGAYEGLKRSGASQIVTVNSVRHASNVIDVSGILADAIRSAQSARFSV